jgi:hypothetical protein
MVRVCTTPGETRNDAKLRYKVIVRNKVVDWKLLLKCILEEQGLGLLTGLN